MHDSTALSHEEFQTFVADEAPLLANLGVALAMPPALKRVLRPSLAVAVSTAGNAAPPRNASFLSYVHPRV